MSVVSPDSSPQKRDLFESIFDELDQGDIRIFERMTPKGRATFLQECATFVTDRAAYEALHAVDYDRVPPSIDTFLTSSDYMGGTGLKIYDGWPEIIREACRTGTLITECILTGAQGRGKCVIANTLQPTSHGMLTAEEVHEQRPGMALSEHGVREITDFHDEGVTAVVETKTKRGYELGARPNHQIRVFDGDQIVWREMQYLQVGDVVVMARGDDVWGTCDGVSVEEAEIMGAWTGDGWIENNAAVLSVGKRKRTYVEDVLIPLCVLRGIPCGDIIDSASLGDKAARWRLPKSGRRWVEFGVSSGAGNKHIPLVIRQAPADVVCAFFRGWFDTDGTVGTDGKVEVCTISKELARQAQVLLLNLGIVTSRTCKKEPKYTYKGEQRIGQPCWIVRVIGRRSRDVFRARIGFNHADKAARLEEVIERAQGNPCSGTEPVYGAHTLVTQAWANLSMHVSTRKPHRSIYSPRWGRSNLTKEKLDQMVAIGGVAHLPPVLLRIYEEDLVTDTVESITGGKEHCYDLSVSGDPSYIGNGFISHNTTAAMCMLAFKIVRLACMRDPSRFYELAPKTNIIFGLYMVTKRQLGDTGFYTLRDQIIDRMPFFQDVFPRLPYGQETIKWERGEKVITVSTNSKAWHSLGTSLFAVAADELNYFDQGQATLNTAREIVTEVSSRLESRFLDEYGDIPGIACFISQTRTESDFLEQRAQEKMNDPHVLVDRGARWERGGPKPFRGITTEIAMRNAQYPVDTVMGPAPGFRIFVGDETSEPRVLDRRPQRQPDSSWHVEPVDPTDHPDPGKVMRVPINYWKRFHDDIFGALRLVADRPTSGFTPFFTRREVLAVAFDAKLINPVTVQTARCYEGQTNFEIADLFQWKRVTNVYMGRRAAIRHPDAPRYIHLDPAKGGKGRDWYGLAMVHPSRHFIQDTSYNDPDLLDDAQVGQSQAVKDVEVDFYLRLTAGPRGEGVNFKAIRVFIDWLQRCGFWIRKVTSDGWQSLDTLQRLREKGYIAEPLSLDRNAKPYLMVRQVFTEGRISIPFPQEAAPARLGSVEAALRKTVLYQELAGLEYDADREKVDHRDRNPDGSQGSKDIADGVTGAAYTCLLDEVSPGENPEKQTGSRAMVEAHYGRFMKQSMVARYLPQE